MNTRQITDKLGAIEDSNQNEQIEFVHVGDKYEYTNKTGKHVIEIIDISYSAIFNSMGLSFKIDGKDLQSTNQLKELFDHINQLNPKKL